MLQNKTVLLGAGGGPLTWVAVDVLRALQRAGARVWVILSTETAAFVPALTFQTLAGGEVVPAEAMYGTMLGGHFRPLNTWVEPVQAMVLPLGPPVPPRAGPRDRTLSGAGRFRVVGRRHRFAVWIQPLRHLGDCVRQRPQPAARELHAVYSNRRRDQPR